MRSAIRKSLVLVLVAVAAIAIGVPVSAQAATATATAPALHASDCATGPSPHNFTLEDSASGYYAEIDSSTSNLYIGGGTPHDFCQALVSSGIVQIFTTSTDYCLAYSHADNDAYQHIPAGCQSTSPPSYMQWKFILEEVSGAKIYALQNVYSGTCVESLYGSTTVTFTSCDSVYATAFYVDAIV
jgi:hypothetical protein